jgi:hypothetical protein
MITARRQGGCHAKPRHDITRYHQCWPGTDPIPRANRLEELRAKTRERVGSSKVLPEKHKTSKTEYTNTQQGLPGIGYTLAHN